MVDETEGALDETEGALEPPQPSKVNPHRIVGISHLTDLMNTFFIFNLFYQNLNRMG